MDTLEGVLVAAVEGMTMRFCIWPDKGVVEDKCKVEYN